MIDFSLTDDQKAVQVLVRDFCAREVKPTIREQDRTATFDPELLRKMASADILGADRQRSSVGDCCDTYI